MQNGDSIAGSIGVALIVSSSCSDDSGARAYDGECTSVSINLYNSLVAAAKDNRPLVRILK